MLNQLRLYGIIVYTLFGGDILKTTISRWGNSAGVRIPQKILAQANIKVGNDVEVSLVREGEIILRAVRKQQSIHELFKDYNGEYYKTEEIDWGSPEGNETW